MLASILNVPELSHRHEGIEINAHHTFEWIFENDELAFAKWLRSEEKFYWIQGKPGSGKSTLMKFIHDDSRTHVLLDTWRNTEEPIIASFFFHHSGTVLQKSLDGLLTSILAQITRQVPWLAHLLSSTIEEVLDFKFPLKEPQLQARLKNHVWKQGELWKMLRHILGQKVERLDLCFFFDALDEHNGPPDVIKDFLGDLQRESSSGMTKLKICFSSRPWESFKESFSKYPGLSIQEHTADDIQAYCYQMLEEHEVSASIIGPLVPEITETASGVFLWARLALRDLIEASGSITDTRALQKKLNNLPRELDNYYVEIVKRCRHSLRMKAYVLLETATRTEGMLPLFQVSLILSCFNSSTFEACSKAITNTIENMRIETIDLEHTQKILANACGGLLEVQKSGDIWYMQLMHQTVREFVRDAKFKSLMLDVGAKYQHENGHCFLSKLYLTQQMIGSTPATPGSSPHSVAGWDTIQYHLKQSEMTTGRNQLPFLISLDPGPLNPCRLSTRGWTSSRFQHLPYAHFYFAADLGLHLCLEELITHQYHTNEEKGVAMIQFLSSKSYFDKAGPDETLRILNLLGYENGSIVGMLFLQGRLDLMSSHPIIQLPSSSTKKEDRTKVELQCPIEKIPGPDPNGLIPQPANIIQIDDDLLQIIICHLEAEVTQEFHSITPFRSGAMICNPTFVEWALVELRHRNDFRIWCRIFVEWAVVFWSLTACDEENFHLSSALVLSTIMIVDDCAKELRRSVQNMATNAAAWPSARYHLSNESLNDGTRDRWEDLKQRRQLIRQLDIWYGHDQGLEANWSYDDTRNAGDHSEYYLQPGKTPRNVEQASLRGSWQETLTATEELNKQRIPALKRNLKTQIKNVFGFSRGG